MPESEVARLREQIELECQAAYHALHAPAVTSPHAFINARFLSMREHREKLAGIVGEQQALKLVMEVMEQTEEISDGNQARPVTADQSATAL